MIGNLWHVDDYILLRPCEEFIELFITDPEYFTHLIHIERRLPSSATALVI